jgi:hypothetical protein
MDEFAIYQRDRKRERKPDTRRQVDEVNQIDKRDCQDSPVVYDLIGDVRALQSDASNV